MKRWMITGLVAMAMLSATAACGGTAAPQATRAASSPAGQSGAAPQPATASPPAPPSTGSQPPSSAASPPPPPASALGPSDAVKAYYADLSAGDDTAAYALLAPQWQAAHPYPAFVAAQAAPAPGLVDATIQSAANFTATVQAVVQTKSGGRQTLTIRLENLDNGAKATGKPAWRLSAPPGQA